MQLLENLTEPQRAAVTHMEGPLLVLAGAGSGKTRVITRRAAYIAHTTGRPDQVLAITFTNKAAGEMRDRIRSLGVGAMWVCTFHSLCARLLRQYGETVGVQPNFSIFDEADSRSALRDVVKKCGPGTESLAPRDILAAISKAKMHLQTPADYERQAHDWATQRIADVYTEYQRLLERQNACDFDDLLMAVAGLLTEHEPVREALSRRFRYLLIDEYQDTNYPQYLIANELARGHRNICATGDPDQSIYAWRGADLRNILDFEADYPEAVVVRLEQNFRSTKAILSAASRLIGHNERRKHKDLWTEDEEGARVRVRRCEDERHEASTIAGEIARLSADGRPPGDVAIFYRVNAMTRVLEEALLSEKIPYQIARGVEFYARKEIKDVLAYLRIIANPADETALLRAINTPPRGIGKVTLARLRNEADARHIPLDQVIAEAGRLGELKSARKGLKSFGELLGELRDLPRSPVRGIVEAVIRRSGIEDALAEAGDNDPLENIYELVTAARDYDRENPDGSLEAWLQQISLVSDIDSLELNGGAVTLMTLHAAKGLEFPIVYIVGLEEGLLPHQRAVKEDRDAVEEERRLAFVGMTRAMRQLTLSHAKYRATRGITERRVASPFLRELPTEEIEHEVLEAERDRSRAHLGESNEGDAILDDVEYYPGRRVRHDEYGEGRVVRLELRGRTPYVRIEFPDFGERSFALEHVRLYIIDD